MAGEFGDRTLITLEAIADLSAHQYNLVHFDAPRGVNVNSHGTGALAPIGVLENKPTANQAASVCYSGLTRVRAGAAIVAGVNITANASGRAITATSGTAQIGRAIEAAAVDGDLISAIIFPAIYQDN